MGARVRVGVCLSLADDEDFSGELHDCVSVVVVSYRRTRRTHHHANWITLYSIPNDGIVINVTNIFIATYVGNSQWYRQEDIYNSLRFARVGTQWFCNTQALGTFNYD